MKGRTVVPSEKRGAEERVEGDPGVQGFFLREQASQGRLPHPAPWSEGTWLPTPQQLPAKCSDGQMDSRLRRVPRAHWKQGLAPFALPLTQNILPASLAHRCHNTRVSSFALTCSEVADVWGDVTGD